MTLLLLKPRPLLLEAWLPLVGGQDASGWLTAFATAPEEAVDDLLWDRFYFGPLNATEREQLLCGWLDRLGNSERFGETLDRTLTSWVEKQWNKFQAPAESSASAWSCLCGVVEFSGKLPSDRRLSRSAAALRARLAERQQFLGNFSTAPAADPLGFYLAAIAEFQQDRSLASLWHRMCDLPEGVPFYHARYAMLGLRRMTSAVPADDGTLRVEIVLGLLRLVRAFDRLVREHRLDHELAHAAFHRVAAQTAAAYRDSPGWRQHGLLDALDLPERPQRWLLESVPPLAEAVRQEQAKSTQRHPLPSRSFQMDPSWSERVKRSLSEIRRRDPDCLPDVERILDEQRRYAETTGYSGFVVRSLCNFASRIRTWRPDFAERWAMEAQAWEPRDPFTWTTLKDVLLVRRQEVRGLRVAWVAWQRFPENVVARTGLAEVLKAVERYPEAETVYRQTIERFPEDVFARNGLAEVLKAVERYPEAETVYRQTMERFPEDVVARTGLAEVLKAVERYPEAETVYRQTIERFPESVFARTGLAEVLKALKRYPEAEAVYRQTIERFPENVVARTGLAEVLKAVERYPEAETVYRQTIERFPESVFARTGLADTLRRAGNLVEAEREFRESIRVGMASHVTYACLAHLAAKRGREGRQEALELLEESLRLDPQNKYARNLKEKLLTSPQVEESSFVPELDQLANAYVDAAISSPLRLQQPGPSSPDDEGASLLEMGQIPETKLPVELEPTGPAAGPGSEIRALDSLGVAALVAEAHFYRGWAKGAPESAALARRKRASEVLAEATVLAPNDASVLAEQAALALDEGYVAGAREQLTVPLETHGGSVALLVVKARIERTSASQEQRKLTDAALQELCMAPKRLRDLDPGFTPLFHFQTGLAALALLDGSARSEKAAEAFSAFRRHLRFRAVEEQTERENSREARERNRPRFHEWLEGRIEARFFASLDDRGMVQSQDMASVEGALAANQAEVEEVEDSFVHSQGLAVL